MSEYEAVSVATISGFGPASRLSSVSRICSESRIVPGTTVAPIAATWSLIALSHVTVAVRLADLRRVLPLR
jgi:hypothetical protein